MQNRAIVFSVLIGTLLIAIGSLLAQAGLANWSLTLVGSLLVGIALLQCAQPVLKPAAIVVESQRRDH